MFNEEVPLNAILCLGSPILGNEWAGMLIAWWISDAVQCCVSQMSGNAECHVQLVHMHYSGFKLSTYSHQYTALSRWATDIPELHEANCCNFIGQYFSNEIKLNKFCFGEFLIILVACESFLSCLGLIWNCGKSVINASDSRD